MRMNDLLQLKGEEAEYMKDFFEEHPRRLDYPSARPSAIFVYRHAEYGNRWLKAAWPGVGPTSFSFREILGEKKTTTGYGKKTDAIPRAKQCAFSPIAA